MPRKSACWQPRASSLACPSETKRLTFSVSKKQLTQSWWAWSTCAGFSTGPPTVPPAASNSPLTVLHVAHSPGENFSWTLEFGFPYKSAPPERFPCPQNPGLSEGPPAQCLLSQGPLGIAWLTARPQCCPSGHSPRLSATVEGVALSLTSLLVNTAVRPTPLV